MLRKLFFSSAALFCLYSVPSFAEEPQKTLKPAKNENAEHGRFRHWLRTLRYGYDPYYYDPYYGYYGYGPYASYYHDPYYRHRFYYGYPRRPRPHIWTTGMGYNDY
jgi:hypothetical protein